MLALSIHPYEGFEWILSFHFEILASEGSFKLDDTRNSRVLLSDLIRVTQCLLKGTHKVEMMKRMEAAWVDARIRGHNNIDVVEHHYKHEDKFPKVVSSELLDNV